jgi:hypothetical protein
MFWLARCQGIRPLNGEKHETLTRCNSAGSRSGRSCWINVEWEQAGRGWEPTAAVPVVRGGREPSTAIPAETGSVVPTGIAL